MPTVEHEVEQRSRQFERDEEAPREARRWLTGVLDDLGVEAVPADLLLSELATNAVVHAGTAFTVDVHVNGTVRVAVGDGDPAGVVAIRPSRPLEEGGRGLALVDALSTDWGVTRTGVGKTVWFEL